jgi:hypothetical protein
MTANDGTAAADHAPGALLAEMAGLRRAARRTRQAYWFPLVVFGLIEAGSAPLYYRRFPPCPDGDLCAATGFGARLFRIGHWYWTLEANLYALLATVAGLGLTVWWYRRHARRVGVRTGTRGPLLAWTGAGIGVLAIAAVPIGFIFWISALQGTTWLAVVAVGLLALARAERSLLLAAIAVLHAVAAGLGIAYDPENLLYRLLHAFGMADADIPFDYSQTVNVLLPAAVLLTGGLAAYLVNRRRPA